MYGALSKHQRTICKTKGAAIPIAKELTVKEEHHVMEAIDVTELVESPDLSTQMVEMMRKVRNEMDSICALHSIDFQELADEHKLTHVEALLDSLDSVLSDPPCSFQSGRGNVTYYRIVLAFEGLEHAIAVYKRC